MSVSGINPDVASATTDVATALKQRRQSIQSLLTAVRSGDLSSAQQALTALQQTGGGRPGGAGDALKNAFAAITSAVSSGDISGAQSALAAWQTKSGRGTAPAAAAATSASAARDQFTGDFASILNAVQSGSISAAQTALKTLQSDAALYSPASKPPADAASTTGASASAKPASPISDDVQSLFAAVQSGDSAAAKAALEKLKADAAAQPHHAHHHHGGGAKPAAAPAATATDSTANVPSGGAAGIADVDGQAANA